MSEIMEGFEYEPESGMFVPGTYEGQRASAIVRAAEEDPDVEVEVFDVDDPEQCARFASQVSDHERREGPQREVWEEIQEDAHRGEYGVVERYVTREPRTPEQVERDMIAPARRNQKQPVIIKTARGDLRDFWGRVAELESQQQ